MIGRAVRPQGGEALAAGRLRSLTGFARAMASAHSVEEVVHTAAKEAKAHLGASTVSVSRWERETGRLRVLVNYGDLANDELPFPKDESYPVTDFPEILFSDDDLGPWIQLAESSDGDPKRVLMLQKRQRSCALIAPIVFNGRAWGELFASRMKDQPLYNRDDMDFAAAFAAQIAAGLAKADHVREVERLAFTDQLTGLANRRAFDARMDAAFDRHRSEGTLVSLVVCDVNGLKRMNDGHGHDHGDVLLVELAGVISAAAALLPGSIAARLGGDEFCLLAEGYTADEVVWVARELCRNALLVRGGEGVACGVASTGDAIGAIETRDRLFRLADAAQYRAKRSRSLEPMVAGRAGGPGQDPGRADSAEPPDPVEPPAPITRRAALRQLPMASRLPDRRVYRGRDVVAVEQLLADGLSLLDAGQIQRGGLPPTLERVAIIADVLARGLDAASWYIYRRGVLEDTLSLEAKSELRPPPDHSVLGDSLAEVIKAQFSPVQITGITDLFSGGARLTVADVDFDIGTIGSTYPTVVSPQLGTAGYVAALSAGATAPDGQQWLVSILLDVISRPASPAQPLLRTLLASALLRN
jgi:diguanylate cyclase (GGDEF)-like protein